jgi:hypothetical protein
MKQLTLALAVMLTLCGCVQIIHERPDGTKLKINTLFKSVTSDGFYYDPNDFMQVDKYTGVPSDIVLEYDPLTNSFKFKAEKGQ